jgi:branched-chain amino acid aminotransferase
VIVVAFPLEPAAPAADVVIVPWSRNERGALAGLKTISYAENVRALAFAEERGAHEAIFPNTLGRLCEATGSNVFLVLDGICCTPPLSAGCLNGVTRQLLLELGNGELAVPMEERDVPVDVLHRADEAFVSSSIREVQPIASVDGIALTAPGPITTLLAEAFTDLTNRDLDP